jgi:hypothetical protein
MTTVRSEERILNLALGATPPAKRTWGHGYRCTIWKMMRTSNCFTLKLSSEQHWCIKELNDTLWELSSASARNLLALLQRLYYYYYYCNNKTQKSNKIANQKNCPCVIAADTRSSERSCEWWLKVRSKRSRSARMRLSSEILSDAWHQSLNKKMRISRILDLSGSKLSEKSCVVFHKKIDLGMPVNWMSQYNIICRRKIAHNWAVWWTKLPSSLRLPLLKTEQLITSWSFCS